jgi:hypothetical protein
MRKAHLGCTLMSAPPPQGVSGNIPLPETLIGVLSPPTALQCEFLLQIDTLTHSKMTKQQPIDHIATPQNGTKIFTFSVDLEMLIQAASGAGAMP